MSVETRRVDSTVTYPFGQSVRGLLLYDAHGYCSARVMRLDRPRFLSGDMQQGTVDEVKAAFAGYLAAAGTYEVDEQQGTITHHVECAVFPNWIDGEQTRFFEIAGNHLLLKSPPIVIGG